MAIIEYIYIHTYIRKVAYSVGVFVEFKLVGGGIAIELDRKAAGLGGPLARTPHSHWPDSHWSATVS